MAWSDTDYQDAFDSEAGDVASVATSSQKRLWFNEGQARLLRGKPKNAALTWAEGDATIDLPADFRQLDRLVPDPGNSAYESWRVLGQQLVHERYEGACAAGAATLWYYADWPKMDDTPAVDSELSAAGDYACLYYALHRFYRLLASNRSYFKRYATLVGANAVSMAELQAEADRYYQDFLDSRADLEPLPAATYFGS